MRRISPKNKLNAVREVLNKNKTLSEVSSKFKVSRQTLALWIKKYQKDPKSGSRVLINGYKRGKNHHKSLSYKLEKQVLDLVIKNPDSGVHIIWKELADRGFKVSLKGVYNVLLRYELQTKELRHRFSLAHPLRTIMAQAISPAYRVKAIEEYLKEGAKISQVCKIWKVSRPTFYAWLKRYREGLAAGPEGALARREAELVEALVRRYKKGYEHHRAISQETCEIILDLVRKRPDFSCHKIYAQIPKAHGRPIVGHHAVQNLLARENLNTEEKRKIYAQGYIVRPEVAPAPEYEMAARPAPSRWRFLYAPFATIPKFIIRTPLTWPLAIPLLILILYIFEVDKLLSPAMFFPSVALTFGLLFFLYSLKYYYSLIIVLAYPGQSQKDNRQKEADAGKMANFLQRINIFKMLSPISEKPLAMQPNLDEVNLTRYPFVSIHLPLYNEKRVAERILRASREIEYPNFEVIIIDDSTDETTEIIKKFLGDRNGKLRETKGRDGEEIVEFIPNHSQSPGMTLIHRASRAGFKGAALQKALEHSDPRTEYVTVFDADFVPFPDTIEQFVKTFQVLAEGQPPINAESAPISAAPISADISDNQRIAAVQGYQWHVLNKSENWVTRGVRTEYAGSYVVERAGIELYGGLKMIAGSVFCIRADVLRRFGWGTSITEDLELTLKLYEAGYKIAFTPYIQAPAEAVSTVRRLIRQRMRWAEGHTFNVRKMWKRLFASRNLTGREKFEFLYLAPYYLQAAFFIIGTFSWFIAETVVHAQLPFWTAAWGWSLVFVNLLSLPLMNLVGLFLEESEERDYVGIASFVLLSYIVVPFQAYAAVKALFEKEEGPWFRTPKTGLITDVVGKARFYRWLERFRLWPVRPSASPIPADIGANPRRADERGFGYFQRDVALATSFNPLTGYKIRPKRVRFVARSALVFVLTLALLVNYLAFFTPGVKAQGAGPEIEQQINISDQTYTIPNDTYSPVDSSLGLFKWDSSVYTDVGVSLSLTFEAVMVNNSNQGQYTSLTCPASTNCKISHYDSDADNLRFLDCGDEACSTSSATSKLLDGATGCVLTGGDNCSTTADVGQYAAISCPSSTNCKIAYYDVTNTALKFADCDDETCSTGSVKRLDGDAAGCALTSCSTTVAVGQSTSIYCVSSTDCKIAYSESLSLNTLKFADCDNETCSVGTAGTIDSVAGNTVGANSSVFCPSDGTPTPGEDCKIIHINSTGLYVRFVDCGNNTCSSNSVSSPTAQGEAWSADSLFCGSATNCKFSYYKNLSSESELNFLDCGDAGCTTGATTTTIVDGYSGCISGCDESAAVGSYESLNCSSSTTNCKIAYYDATNTNLKFVDCDNETCGSGTFNGNIDSGAKVFTGLFDVTAGSQVTCSGGSPDDGTGVSVSTQSKSYVRVRTGESPNNCTFSLTSGNNYTVQVRGSNGQTGILRAGRIIIVQSHATLLGKSETQVEVGDQQGSLSAATYTLLTNNKIYLYDSSKFNPTPQNTYFEATFNNGNTTNTVSAQLLQCVSDVDCLLTNAGLYASIACPSSTDCKIAYYDLTNTALKFVDCDNETCSSGTVNTLDSAPFCVLTNCVTTSSATGILPAIACPSSTDCKIAYWAQSGDTGLKFADCDNATCSSGRVDKVDSTTTTIGQYPSISCAASTDCQVAYYSAGTAGDLWFLRCLDSNANSYPCDAAGDRTTKLLDGASGCVLTSCSTIAAVGQYTSIACPASTNCKISYFSTTGGDLKFANCTNEACSAGTVTSVETTNQVGQYTSMACPSSTNCKIAYYDLTNSALRFADCGDETCTNGNATFNTLEGDASGCVLTGCSTSAAVGLYTSMSCPSSTNCKISYYDATSGANDLKFANCTNEACSAGSVTLLDGNTNCTLDSCSTSDDVGHFTAINCSAASTNCKIAYRDVTNTALKFGDCDTEACSSASAGDGSTALLDGVDGCPLTDCSLKSVSGSPVSTSTQTTNYSLVRSGTITLTSGKNYTVAFKVSGGSTSAIVNAKVIIDQNDTTNGITALETVQLYNNYEVTDADSTYTNQLFNNLFDPNNFSSGTKTYYFDSTLKSSGTATGYAQLFRCDSAATITCGTSGDSGAITGGEVSDVSTSFVRKRSGDISANIPSGARAMDNQIKNSSTQTTTSSGSWLVIQLSGLPVPEYVIFALPGILFLPKIVSWWKRRRLSRRKKRIGADKPPRRCGLPLVGKSRFAPIFNTRIFADSILAQIKTDIRR